jgi:phenylpropionate dioxygenase-like ring-hydroxylating dioxygenase large terminal subunit
MINDPVIRDDWHPVFRTDALPDGTLAAARLMGEDIVLWRSTGQVQAWQDLCIHRGTRLSLGEIRSNKLRCPYHGWEYDPAGICVHIPAHPEQTPPSKARVRTYLAQERYGMIWVSLGNPQQDLPTFPEELDPVYRKVLAGPFGPIKAGAPRILENFLDVAHFPFVHAGSLGDERWPEIEDYTVETGPQGVAANNVRVYQPDPYGTGIGDTVNYQYRVVRPFTAYLAKQTKMTRFSILFPITPVDENTSIAWFYMGLDRGYDLPDEEITRFHSSILAQDIPIVESQRPELLPLDLQAELHLRSDRTSIAYRRWLKELGLSFGTE